jgi:hypothetical protein
MSTKINDILSRVAGLERYQGVSGKLRRDMERQVIIGAVNRIVGTLQKERIDVDVDSALEAIKNGIRLATKHFENAVVADKTLPFGSSLPGKNPVFVDSLAFGLGIAVGKLIQDTHAKIAADIASANAQAKADDIAAAAALPQEPEPAPAPARKASPDVAAYIAAMRAAVAAAETPESPKITDKNHRLKSFIADSQKSVSR